MSPSLLIAAIAWPQVACIAIWAGLVVLTVALPILMRSEWGKAQPLRRCIVLSIWAHVLLAAFATTVPVVRSLGPPGPGAGGVMRVTMIDGEDLAALEGPVSDAEPTPATLVETPPLEEAPPTEAFPVEEVPPEVKTPALEPVAAPEVPFPPPLTEAPVEETPFDDLPPSTEEVAPSPEANAAQPPDSGPAFPDADSELVDVASPPLVASVSQPTAPAIPQEYAGRRARDKQSIVSAGGGSADTEAAVAAALAWLAAVQSRDGRWDADQFGAGRGGQQDPTRGGAGLEADTGVTGLALLTFLAAGHTHEEGDYQDTVQKGLQFLLSSQAENGNLAGRADVFAGMYCHGMAGVALAEAYGMTADEKLKRPVERAVMYTLAAQHPRSGGWRYRPGDLGDTSQLGWQLMLLRSARIAGIDVKEDAFVGAGVFLKYVSAGEHGGLAAYRFNEQISSPMTAEALACRQFLGLSADSPTAKEAATLVLTELPGAGTDNFYFWYYGTLALHHHGGEAWETWNRALQTRLLSTQTPSGAFAGSWNPDQTWGGYGGRIYSTALATLSLEVYYRYLPMIDETAAKSRRLK